MEYIKPIEIPKNVQNFLNTFISVFEVSINTLDALNGYGTQILKTCHVKMYRKKCIKCGFDNIFNLEEKCERRHLYEEDYVDVFTCSFIDAEDIEFSFSVFLNQPAFKISFDRIERDFNNPIKTYSRI